MFKRAWLLLWLPACGLVAASCGSDSNTSPSGASGAGGEPAAAGEPGTAGTGIGASSSQGGASPSQAGAGAAPGAAGFHDAAGAPPAGGNDAGGAASQGGASGEDGGVPGGGGMPPLVTEASCIEHEDCLPVCNANGWPQAHCFGSSERFCSCESDSGGPMCVKGTTQGCPTGTACRSPQQCMPYGDATQGEPCDNGDECAPGFTCVGFGNPLPNGSSTGCGRFCDAQTAPPGCDCVAGYCTGGMGLYDISCDYPSGTPCGRSVAATDTRVARITGPGEITPGDVYLVSLEAAGGQDLELEVCGSSGECEGDHVCEATGAGSASCLVQAADDELFVYMINRDDSSASMQVDVEADAMSEYELSYVQLISSLEPGRYRRLLVTGLTAGTSYDFQVATANGRDINLIVSNDLHGQNELCNEDLMVTFASCVLTVTKDSVWVVLTDTSALGDGFTFKVTAQ